MCLCVCDCVLLSVVTCVRLCMSLQVFSNCSCVGVAGNFTASTGQCLHKDDCDRMFPYFLALSVITSFIISLGGTPGYMFLIRSDISQKYIMKKKKDFWSNLITTVHTAKRAILTLVPSSPLFHFLSVLHMIFWWFFPPQNLHLDILNNFKFALLMHLYFGQDFNLFIANIFAKWHSDPYL